jgi:hypothetical protein
VRTLPLATEAAGFNPQYAQTTGGITVNYF